MGEKSIRKVVQLVITKEEWIPQTLGGGDQIGYTVKGEVKNVGLSAVRNALIVAGIINSRTRKLYQVLTKKFKVYKAADYSILPKLASGESVPFEITVLFPKFREIVFGKYKLQKLEDHILEERYKYKSFLIYDPKALDEKTQDWFREEQLESLKLMGSSWDEVLHEDGSLMAYKCTGKIKNVGTRTVKNFFINGMLVRPDGEPLVFAFEDKEYTISAEVIFKELEQNKTEQFEMTCNIPTEDILVINNWSTKELQKSVEDGKIKKSIRVNYTEETLAKAVYRDTEETPTVIEEVRGEKNIESEDESWVFDEDNAEYLVTGLLKNTGTRDVDDIYIIASLTDVENKEPIVWETATDTYKTLFIEKVPFLQVKEEYTFAVRMKVPSGKIFGKNQWNSRNIPEGVASEKLKQTVELYYMKEDIHDEGMKRLRLGNSYFQLKNYRGCLREYNEGIRLVPNEKMFFFNIGLCYYKMDDPVKAIEYCNRAVTIDKNFYKAYYLMGLVSHNQKDYDSALKHYLKGYKIEKDDAKILYNIACVQFGLQKIDEGINWLRRAVNIDKSVIMSQIIKDPELRPLVKNAKFADFLKNIREEAYAGKSG